MKHLSFTNTILVILSGAYKSLRMTVLSAVDSVRIIRPIVPAPIFVPTNVSSVRVTPGKNAVQLTQASACAAIYLR